MYELRTRQSILRRDLISETIARCSEGHAQYTHASEVLARKIAFGDRSEPIKRADGACGSDELAVKWILRALKLRREGLSWRDVSAEIGVPKETLPTLEGGRVSELANKRCTLVQTRLTPVWCCCKNTMITKPRRTVVC
jgi:hypothetical protein